jgi:hypothetical protein
MESVAGHRVGRAIASDRGREHLFFISMAVAMALIVLTGFARSFFFAFMWSQHDPDSSSEPVYYVHGTLAAAWMAFAIVQPLLIRSRKVQWHRKLGWFGAVLSGAAMLTGVYVAVLSAARAPGSPLEATPLDFLGVITSGIVIFGVFVGLAVAYRRDGPAHKRLMYLATINLIQAAVVRLPWSFVHSAGPWITYPVAYVFILPLFIWDLSTRGRLHAATLWGGLGIIVSLPIRIWLSQTSAWLAVARWVVHLVSK